METNEGTSLKQFPRGPREDFVFGGEGGSTQGLLSLWIPPTTPIPPF